MKKTIIFDFWGTLADNGVRSPMRQVRSILGLDDMEYGDFVMKFEGVFMTKRFESLNEAFTEVCESFAIKYDDLLLGRLVGIWNTNWLLAKLYPETMSVLDELKGKYKLVLVSNTDCFSLGKVLEKYKLAGFFELIVLSYEWGLLKTDPGFYKKILDDIAVSPDECIVFGDTVETDMLAAKNAGIDSVLVDRSGRRDFEIKIDSLNSVALAVEKFNSGVQQ